MTINAFQDEYRFLSNFWYVSKPIHLTIENSGMPDDNLYFTTENAYQAAKTLYLEERDAISRMKPGDAKRYAKNKVVLRSDWEQIKVPLMLDLLRQKFKYPLLRMLLLKTGNQDIIEGNTWHDNIWGVCMCHNCTIRYGDTMEPGNMLGKLLMQVREEIRNEVSTRV